MFDDDLVAYGKKSLEDRGVQFRLNAKIQAGTEDGFVIGEGDEREEIKAGTVVWTGGVTGSPVLSGSGFELTRGKVTVDGDLRAPGEENIFIIGDCAWVMDEQAGRPYPPTAHAAMQ